MSDGDVVVPQQDEIQVYENGAGGVAIRQADGCGEEAVIWMAPQHAKAVAEALIRVAEAISKG